MSKRGCKSTETRFCLQSNREKVPPPNQENSQAHEISQKNTNFRTAEHVNRKEKESRGGKNVSLEMTHPCEMKDLHMRRGLWIFRLVTD